MTTDPAVEQWARPTTPPATHPATKFGAKATAAGWRVEYRAARGPLTVRRRPDEPDERGKYALVSVVEVVDTLGVRAAHPDGRRLAAWWVGTAFGEGWVASPRRNARSLGICLAGTGRFTPAQWQSLSTLVRSLHARHPAARLCGHRDLSPDRNGDGVVSPAEWTKTCPGFSVADWLAAGMRPAATAVTE